MIFIIPRLRGTDAQGSGAYGAPRKGGRKHKGLDYACRPGTEVFAAVDGHVTRFGYPYSGNKELRLIEIAGPHNSLIRYMYVEPAAWLRKGYWVQRGDWIGTVQRLPYKGIKQHVHVDVKVMKPGGQRRKFVDPEEFFAST